MVPLQISWSCIPINIDRSLKHEGYEPADSFELVGRVKSSIFNRERLLKPIFGLVPLWNTADINQQTHHIMICVAKSSIFHRERLLKPIFGLMPLWSMKDMSQQTQLNWSIDWQALYFIGKRLLKPRFGLVPLWNMKDMNLQTHYINRWSEKLDISSEKTTELHI